MSKVELASRPEPGYESMDQFTVSVEHVAEMLRTIDFQPGEGMSTGRGGSRHPGSQTHGAGGRGLARPGRHLTGPSVGPGAAGEEDDEEVVLDGDEGTGVGPDERQDAPEGECPHAL